jgi:hypothetical protein
MLAQLSGSQQSRLAVEAHYDRSYVKGGVIAPRSVGYLWISALDCSFPSAVSLHLAWKMTLASLALHLLFWLEYLTAWRTCA